MTFLSKASVSRITRLTSSACRRTRGVFAERKDLRQQLAGLNAGAFDDVEILVQLGSARGLKFQRRGSGDDAHHQIVEIVDGAAGKPADQFEPLRFDEFLFESALAGHIDDDPGAADDFAVLPRRMHERQADFRFAGLVAETKLELRFLPRPASCNARLTRGRSAASNISSSAPAAAKSPALPPRNVAPPDSETPPLPKDRVGGRLLVATRRASGIYPSPPR